MRQGNAIVPGLRIIIKAGCVESSGGAAFINWKSKTRLARRRLGLRQSPLIPVFFHLVHRVREVVVLVMPISPASHLENAVANALHLHNVDKLTF